MHLQVLDESKIYEEQGNFISQIPQPEQGIFISQIPQSENFLCRLDRTTDMERGNFVYAPAGVGWEQYPIVWYEK